MNDRSQLYPFSMPIPGSDFFQLMSASPLGEIQRRNLETMSKSAAKISETIAAVASKQMSAFSDLSALRAVKAPEGQSDLAGYFAAQIHSGREAMEKAIAGMRDASDALRHCWYEVVDEFEACAKANMSSMEAQLKQTALEQGASTRAAQPRKAAAE